ncbi:MAG: hypothetical protein Ct9H300mP29_9110 [Candidatus Neomarinimicrobiota bacterium]|nr:MAG: hypothetical protein Ct9H300mP29_9110 [Candidatus Neomarinimicrobiota bacterium]
MRNAAVDYKVPVGMFSLEMANHQLAQRPFVRRKGGTVTLGALVNYQKPVEKPFACGGFSC